MDAPRVNKWGGDASIMAADLPGVSVALRAAAGRVAPVPPAPPVPAATEVTARLVVDATVPAGAVVDVTPAAPPVPPTDVRPGVGVMASEVGADAAAVPPAPVLAGVAAPVPAAPVLAGATAGPAVPAARLVADLPAAVPTALPAAPEADLAPTIELPEVPDVPAAQPATAAPAGWGQARWSRPPNVVDRRTSQGVMVLPAEGPAVVLDGLAARVWEAVDGPVAAGDVAADLVRHGAAGAVAEVEAALRDLRAIGALRELR